MVLFSKFSLCLARHLMSPTFSGFSSFSSSSFFSPSSPLPAVSANSSRLFPELGVKYTSRGSITQFARSSLTMILSTGLLASCLLSRILLTTSNTTFRTCFFCFSFTTAGCSMWFFCSCCFSL